MSESKPNEQSSDPVVRLATAAYDLGGAPFLGQSWTETLLRLNGVDQKALDLIRQRYQKFESAVAAFPKKEFKVEVINGNTLRRLD